MNLEQLGEAVVASIAGTDRRITLYTAGGDAVVLISEAALRRLQDRAARAPLLEDAVPVKVPEGLDAAKTDVQMSTSVVHLTRREGQVLGAVAAGLTGLQVADELRLSASTVSQHLVAIRRKYRVRTTRDAVRAAAADGQLGCAE